MTRWKPAGLIPFALLLAMGGIAACAASGGGGGGDRLTAEEIQSVSVGNAFELVAEVRPAWLRSRTTRDGSGMGPGPGSHEPRQPIYPQVYVDGQRVGDVESLRTLGVDRIQEMRLIRPADAVRRFGSGHEGGVIEVVRR